MKEYGKSSTIQLCRFYVRRAYRILPAAMAFMVPVFVIYWHELRWYHMAAAALYVVNFDFGHPWFLGHLRSISVQEQFYFLWPSVLRKWYRRRVPILVGVVAFAPVYRVVCHFLQFHGKADETFPPVADILAIGCPLAIFETSGHFLLRIGAAGAEITRKECGCAKGQNCICNGSVIIDGAAGHKTYGPTITSLGA